MNPPRELVRSMQAAAVMWLIAKALNQTEREERARESFASLVAGALGLQELIGRTEVMAAGWRADADAMREAVAQIRLPKPRLSEIEWPVYTDVPGGTKLGQPPVFKEALREIEERVPVAIQPAWRRTAQAVGELYRVTGSRVVTAVKAADEATSGRVQRYVAGMLKEGKPLPDQVKALSGEFTDWGRAYSETVLRTNLSGVRSAGRLAQAADPVMGLVVAGLGFVAIRDGRVRPNHLAADGTIAPASWEGWASLVPPLGYNCRCTLRVITRPMARRMGLLKDDGTLKVVPPKSGAGPDLGFVHAGRPLGVVAG